MNESAPSEPTEPVVGPKVRWFVTGSNQAPNTKAVVSVGMMVVFSPEVPWILTRGGITSGKLSPLPWARKSGYQLVVGAYRPGSRWTIAWLQTVSSGCGFGG